jgi:hypothetical protein
MADASAVAAHPREGRARAPWTQQWVERLGIAPLWVGGAVAGLQIAGSLLCLALFGRDLDASRRQLFLASNLLMALLAGYSICATAYANRAQRRTLHELRPALDLDGAGFEAALSTTTRFHQRILRVAGVLGVACTLQIVLFDQLHGHVVSRGISFDAMLAWQIWANAVVGWLGLRSIVHELVSLRALSRLGARHARVDLWDLRPLAPFVRRGLLTVLLWIVALSLLSLLVLGGWASDIVPFMLLALVAVAIAAFLLPLLGVHARIVATKRERLDALHAAIRGEEQALEAPDPAAASRAALQLPALLALRTQVQSAREWPIDLSAMLRFGFYVTIGLGSWLGSAIVERLLGAALG